MNHDRGAMSVVAVALVALIALLGAMVADVGVFIAYRLQVAAAADAAALAAAPVTFRSYGSNRSAIDEAARFAAANGARLVRCACSQDASLDSRDVTVIVEREARLLFFGTHTVRAVSRAQFDPATTVTRGSIDAARAGVPSLGPSHQR